MPDFAMEADVRDRVPSARSSHAGRVPIAVVGAMHGQVSFGYETIDNRRMPHFRHLSLPSRDRRDAGHGQPRMRSTRYDFLT